MIQEIDEDNADDVGGSQNQTESSDRDYGDRVPSHLQEPSLIISYPPASHIWRRPSRAITPPAAVVSPIPESNKNDDDDQLIENKEWGESRTVFGKVMEGSGVSNSQIISHKDNKDQLKNSAKVVDNVTSIPLSDFCHKFTQVCFALVFLANVVVGILDIVDSPSFLHYKLTALVFATVENIIIISAWTVLTLGPA